MSERTFQIAVGDGAITAIETAAEGESAGWTFVYAPGAGSNVHDQFGTFACRELATRGVRCVRIQFPYQEAKGKSPDRNDKLEETWRAAINAVRDDSRLVVGGRSMGGRIASQVVAQGVEVDALALFAYPLHPPGNPEKRRDSHLPSIRVPTFFCSGANDAFASPEELEEAASLVKRSRVYSLGEGVDHGFTVRKASGKTKELVWGEAVSEMWKWLSKL